MPARAVVAASASLMIAMSVTAMAAVSEQMHERTSEQKEVWQKTEQVRAMLGEKEKSRDDPEGDKYPTASRSPKRIARVYFSCHVNPLCTVAAKSGTARQNAAGPSLRRLARLPGGLARGLFRRRLCRSVRMLVLVICSLVNPLDILRVRLAALRVMVVTCARFGLRRVVFVLGVRVRGGGENRAGRKNYRCQWHAFHLLSPSSVVKKTGYRYRA